MTTTKREERRPEGKEGAGAHQEGRGSIQPGQTNKRAHEPAQNGSGARNYTRQKENDSSSDRPQRSRG